MGVSTFGINFLFYHLSFMYFTSSLFAPNFHFFASASASNTVRRSPRNGVGIRNINTTPPPLSDRGQGP